ncbi:MAG: DUF4911 domain-containing protein [Bacillota bacterium]
MIKEKNSFKEKDTHQIIIKIPQEEIVYVDMIFKAYGGLAMLTISHEEEGVIFLDVTEGTHETVLDIVNGLREEFPLEIIKD